jgi:hypothetical protein
MKPTGRSLVLASALVLSLALAACTGEEGTGDATGASGGGEGPTETISVAPGATVYRYVNAGLVATLDLDAATLEIENRTGRELPKPGFYVLDATDGTRIDGRVVAGTEVAAGETATFDVRLDGVAFDEIGLVVLLMGRDNYGAFVKQ